MSPDLFLTTAVRPALALLPEPLRSGAAEAQLVAIAWQESRIAHRHQIGGPAHSFLQFEFNGVRALLGHKGVREAVTGLFSALSYPWPTTPYYIHQAVEHNDVLACGLGRLLLAASPLPLGTDAESGWRIYLDAWRPGKPKPETWAEAWAVGQEAVR